VSPFQYRLQPLLDLRLERRDACLRVHAGLQRELLEEKRILAELENEQEHLKLKINVSLRERLKLGSDVQGNTAELHTLHLQGLIGDLRAGKDAVAAQRVRVSEFQDRVAETRKRVVEAARDVEVLKKHRERLTLGALRAAERTEALEQDEISVVMFNNGRRSERF
jgi:flagellar biosynthesis chaperone FliJ